MKLAIMSDSHDRWDHLEWAVNLANEKECSTLLFAGDFIAPPGLAVLGKFLGNVKFVWGNNDGEIQALTRKMDASEKIELAGDIYEGELGGVRIFMNHYPRPSELAAKSGEYDLVVFGHTHEYHEEKIGETWLLNPGEIQGYLSGNVTFIVFDCETREREKITLD